MRGTNGWRALNNLTAKGDNGVKFEVGWGKSFPLNWWWKEVEKTIPCFHAEWLDLPLQSGFQKR